MPNHNVRYILNFLEGLIWFIGSKMTPRVNIFGWGQMGLGGTAPIFGVNFTFTQLFKNMIKIIFISAVSNKIEGFYIKHCGVNFDPNLITMQNQPKLVHTSSHFHGKQTKMKKKSNFIILYSYYYCKQDFICWCKCLWSAAYPYISLATLCGLYKAARESTSELMGIYRRRNLCDTKSYNRFTDTNIFSTIWRQKNSRLEPGTRQC